jgi:GH24 family phage-related lysozyme (muramidase)
MHTSVVLAFPIFTTRFEGRVNHMYLCVKGWVTIGLGCKIDPAPLAQSLPFMRISDGKPASPNEIDAEWRKTKGNKQGALRGAQYMKRFALLKLSEAAIDELALWRLRDIEKFLRTTFHDWDEWPADAQLGVLSMAWAMGPAFTRNFPKFTAAAKARNWREAALECRMDETGNEGLIARNAANRKLFMTAAEPCCLPIRVLRGWS